MRRRREIGGLITTGSSHKRTKRIIKHSQLELDFFGKLRATVW